MTKSLARKLADAKVQYLTQLPVASSSNFGAVKVSNTGNLTVNTSGFLVYNAAVDTGGGVPIPTLLAISSAVRNITNSTVTLYISIPNNIYFAAGSTAAADYYFSKNDIVLSNISTGSTVPGTITDLQYDSTKNLYIATFTANVPGVLKSIINAKIPASKFKRSDTISGVDVYNNESNNTTFLVDTLNPAIDYIVLKDSVNNLLLTDTQDQKFILNKVNAYLAPITANFRVKFNRPIDIGQFTTSDITITAVDTKLNKTTTGSSVGAVKITPVAASTTTYKYKSNSTLSAPDVTVTENDQYDVVLTLYKGTDPNLYPTTPPFSLTEGYIKLTMAANKVSTIKESILDGILSNTAVYDPQWGDATGTKNKYNNYIFLSTSGFAITLAANRTALYNTIFDFNLSLTTGNSTDIKKSDNTAPASGDLILPSYVEWNGIPGFTKTITNGIATYTASLKLTQDFVNTGIAADASGNFSIVILENTYLAPAFISYGNTTKNLSNFKISINLGYDLANLKVTSVNFPRILQFNQGSINIDGSITFNRTYAQGAIAILSYNGINVSINNSTDISQYFIPATQYTLTLPKNNFKRSDVQSVTLMQDYVTSFKTLGKYAPVDYTASLNDYSPTLIMPNLLGNNQKYLISLVVIGSGGVNYIMYGGDAAADFDRAGGGGALVTINNLEVSPGDTLTFLYDSDASTTVNLKYASNNQTISMAKVGYGTDGTNISFGQGGIASQINIPAGATYNGYNGGAGGDGIGGSSGNYTSNGSTTVQYTTTLYPNGPIIDNTSYGVGRTNTFTGTVNSSSGYFRVLFGKDTAGTNEYTGNTLRFPQIVNGQFMPGIGLPG